MIHITGKETIVQELDWQRCKRYPVLQRFCVMEQDFAVETIYGTMSARCGDVLMEGDTGKLYAMAKGEFERCYKVIE